VEPPRKLVFSARQLAESARKETELGLLQKVPVGSLRAHNVSRRSQPASLRSQDTSLRSQDFSIIFQSEACGVTRQACVLSPQACGISTQGGGARTSPEVSSRKLVESPRKLVFSARKLAESPRKATEPGLLEKFPPGSRRDHHVSRRSGDVARPCGTVSGILAKDADGVTTEGAGEKASSEVSAKKRTGSRRQPAKRRHREILSPHLGKSWQFRQLPYRPSPGISSRCGRGASSTSEKSVSTRKVSPQMACP
jgi:hypothetical protein